MPNLFEKELGIPLPQCCNTGACCKGASPSTPYHMLMAKAAAGDEFAQGFFSIMVPYLQREEAERVVPGIVERTLAAAKKQPDVFKTEADIVFYQCRYQTADNKCGVWEDRPQFCRDYPDTPFVVMAPGCAFEPWGAACKKKYADMKAEVEKLKELKAELAALKALQAGGSPEIETALSQVALSGDAGLSDASFYLNTPAEETDTGEMAASKNGSAIAVSAFSTLDFDLRMNDCDWGVEQTTNLSLVLSLTRLYLASPSNAIGFLH